MTQRKSFGDTRDQVYARVGFNRSKRSDISGRLRCWCCVVFIVLVVFHGVSLCCTAAMVVVVALFLFFFVVFCSFCPSSSSPRRFSCFHCCRLGTTAAAAAIIITLEFILHFVNLVIATAVFAFNSTAAAAARFPQHDKSTLGWYHRCGVVDMEANLMFKQKSRKST